MSGFPPLFAALAAGLAAAACGAPPPRAVPPSGPELAVPLATVRMTDLASPFDAGGTLTARATALVSSRIVAPILNVAVRPGDAVRQGETLVTLDTRDLSAQATAARASLEAARQAAAAAAAEAAGAAATLDLARAAHRRTSALAAERSATPQELDDATAALKVAEARMAGADAQVRERAAALDAAQSAAVAAGVTASYGALTAPFDGVVTERDADPGTTAAPGRTLLVVEDAAALTLDVRLDAARAGGVHLRDAVEVQIGDAAPWRDGRVVEIARIDPDAHSFRVKVAVPADAGLRPGLFGRARFDGPRRPALTVPATALVRRGQLVFVFVADADNVARLRAVSVGETAGDAVEVLDGLAAGERTVAVPPAALADGARVTPAAPPAVSGAGGARR